MEELKICTKCNVSKTLDNFGYCSSCKGKINPRCKQCERKTKAALVAKKKQDPEWVQKERARHRKLKTIYRTISSKESQSKYARNYIEKFPEKYKCRLFTRIRLKPIKGFNLHHWSYNEEHWLDVIPLLKLEHNKLHRYLEYDQPSKMYKTIEGILLDTKEKHIEYYNSLKDKP